MANAAKVQMGQTVNVHYTGTLPDGTEFDSSHTRGEPITFELGSGQLIAGFDSAVTGMAVGETKQVILEPAQAYGEHNPELIQEVAKDAFPPDFSFVVGGVVQGQNALGQPVFATVESVGDEAVSLDMNHPMAGKTLTFDIELVGVNSEEDTATDTTEE